MAAAFDVIVENSKGQVVDSFHCESNVCTVGKAGDNDVVLGGWRVASYHAEVHMTPAGLFVEDTTGRGRLEVNGKSVTRHGPLGSTDKVGVGGYSLRAGIGQIYYFNDRTVGLPNEPTGGESTSPLVTEVAARISRTWQAKAALQWDPNQDGGQVTQALAQRKKAGAMNTMQNTAAHTRDTNRTQPPSRDHHSRDS